jgi:hypothetical protein
METSALDGWRGSVILFGSLSRTHWDRERKLGARTNRAFDPDFAAVQPDKLS